MDWKRDITDIDRLTGKEPRGHACKRLMQAAQGLSKRYSVMSLCPSASVRRGSPDPAVRPTVGLQVTRQRSGAAKGRKGPPAFPWFQKVGGPFCSLPVAPGGALNWSTALLLLSRSPFRSLAVAPAGSTKKIFQESAERKLFMAHPENRGVIGTAFFP